MRGLLVAFWSVVVLQSLARAPLVEGERVPRIGGDSGQLRRENTDRILDNSFRSNNMIAFLRRFDRAKTTTAIIIP